MPMRVVAETINDARKELWSLRAIMMGPLLMAGALLICGFRVYGLRVYNKGYGKFRVDLLMVGARRCRRCCWARCPCTDSVQLAPPACSTPVHPPRCRATPQASRRAGVTWTSAPSASRALCRCPTPAAWSRSLWPRSAVSTGAALAARCCCCATPRAGPLPSWCASHVFLRILRTRRHCDPPLLRPGRHSYLYSPADAPGCRLAPPGLMVWPRPSAWWSHWLGRVMLLPLLRLLVALPPLLVLLPVLMPGWRPLSA